MSERLLPQHAALIRGSAISDEVAAARGYRSVEQKARLTELGFSQAQARVPALLIPIIGVQGDIVLYRGSATGRRSSTRPRRAHGWRSMCRLPAGQGWPTRMCPCS